MYNNNLYKLEKECNDLLKYIFSDALQFYNKIAPNGLKKTEYILFLHPTAKQQYEEHIRINENVSFPSKIKNKEDEKIRISDFKQDDLMEISEYNEFLYILGLSVYDIFSNNHEVIGNDNKIYDRGSLRGSGGFMADFFNEDYPDKSKKYDYMDFYIGTIWIHRRGNLTSFYEYIFQKLKYLNCDWKYSFPRMYLVDPINLFDNSNDMELEKYKPEKAVEQQLELTDKEKQTKKLQEELDEIYKEKYEEAKYKPLSQIVQAYKNVYGQLPNGHPQKDFV